jgi:7-cyano-7-deazaguanine synthase
VVLLSGGLDSATVLALARAHGQRVHALSFRYQQRHSLELECAIRQARRQGVVAHEIVDLAGLGTLTKGASALVRGSSLEVPKRRGREPGGEVPVTYVPARNLVFLACALGWAESVGARHIWIGVNAVDYSGYPDCRPEFVTAFERLANLGTRRGTEAAPEQAFRVQAPLVGLRKHEIILLGMSHGVDYEDTLSCYDPVVREGKALACGACQSCELRREGFARANLADPTRYAG